jgi:hypothetical protein
MRSLREAASVIGIDGGFSVVGDFLRFLEGVPDRDTSLRAHVDGMLGPHLTLNLIRISHEDFTGTDLQNIDIAIQDARDIYAQVGVGVNIDHLHIDREDAEDFRVITRESRAKKLLRRFRGPGNRNLDVLLVLVLQIDSFAVGIAAAPDCPTKCKDKDRLGRRGAAVGMNFALYGLGIFPTSPQMRARTILGMALAHEVGHLLLGTDHTADINNLMSASSGGADNLTDGQGNTIRASCAVVG